MYDVARWVQASGEDHGWDGSRLLLSGISAGSKLAINICQQIHAAGGMRPLALSLVVPMPPTLIQTGEYDTLAAEGAELADMLAAAGVDTVYRHYPGADHGFYSAKPIERVSRMLTEITDFFEPRINAHRV